MRSSTPLPSRWLRRRRAPGSRGSLRSCGSLASGCCRRQLQATRVMLSSRRRSIFLNRRSRGSCRSSMSMLPLLTRTARVIKGSSSRSSGSAGPRPVCLLRGAVEDMVQVVEHADGVAELRRPHRPGFFTGTRRSEQIEWIEDLLSRGGPIPDDAPAVCVLDTGVQREHRLLTDALNGADCHCVDAQWRPDPVCPHGTEMAGPALYGDLESAPASFVGYEPIAPAGDLAPTSRTSASFAHTDWPFKPDAVADGGTCSGPRMAAPRTGPTTCLFSRPDSSILTPAASSRAASTHRLPPRPSQCFRCSDTRVREASCTRSSPGISRMPTMSTVRRPSTSSHGLVAFWTAWARCRSGSASRFRTSLSRTPPGVDGRVVRPWVAAVSGSAIL